MSERLLRAVRDTHALLAATRDVAAAARVVAEQVVDVLDAAAAIICIPDGAAGLRVAYATRRWAGVPHDAPRFVLRLCDEARQQGQTITRPMPELEAVTRDVPRVSAVPVHHADHVVAVIGVGWPSSGTELGAVQLLSAPLGPALELLRQASDLSTATQIATALLEFLCRDVRSILDEADVQHLALRLATKVLQPASAAIWLFEPDQSLRCSAGVGYPRRSDGELVPLNEVLTRQAAVDVVNLAQAAHTGGLACSYLGVPIQRHGRSLGALEIIGAAGRHYRPEEEALLIGLASGMAIGVMTAREAAELDQEERRLSAILEQMPGGVLVLDRLGQPVLMNSASRRMFGRQFELDRPITDQTADLDLHAVHNEERLPAGALLGRVLAGEEIRGYEATFRPAGSDGEHWLHASAVPLRDAAAQIVGAVIAVTDVSRERRLAGDLATTLRQNLYLHGALSESQQRMGDLIEHLLRPQGARPPPDVDRQLATLTPREREVLALLGQGKSTNEMMRVLQLSAGTVRLHVKHVLAKLGVSSRTQAALRAQALGQTPVL